jgi:hypothetical protein
MIVEFGAAETLRGEYMATEGSRLHRNAEKVRKILWLVIAGFFSAPAP